MAHSVATPATTSDGLRTAASSAAPAAPDAPAPAHAAPAAPAIPAPRPISYEHALAELDRLVAQMEGGQLPLDELLVGYRRGNELLGYCRQRLQAVEDQVKLLDDGQLTVWTDA